MQGQKASRADRLEKIVNEYGRALEQLYMEMTYQRQINETLANVCKQLPGWDEAVEELKKINEEAKSKEDTDIEGGLELGPKGADTTSEQEEVSEEKEA